MPDALFIALVVVVLCLFSFFLGVWWGFREGYDMGVEDACEKLSEGRN